MSNKKSNNLWNGKLKEKELKLYPGLNQKDINLIMEYQKLLPIMNQESEGFCIDARTLYEQLGVNNTKTKFADWIKNNLGSIDAEKDLDYSIRFKTNGQFTQEEIENMSPQKRSAYKISEEYHLTLECAKELCMVIGALPRTNVETKHISKIARKYFIAIEKAFKSRYEWNKDRLGTIQQYNNLRQVIYKDLYTDNRLGDFVTDWWRIVDERTGKKNTYAYELYKLDLVVIGMSAQRYREIHKLHKSIPIRNTFSEKMLEELELLQSKSAEYITVNEIWNTEERMKKLSQWLELYRQGKLL